MKGPLWILGLCLCLGCSPTMSKPLVAEATPEKNYAQAIGEPEIPLRLTHLGSEHGIKFDVDVPKVIPEEDVRYQVTNVDGTTIHFWRGRGPLGGQFVLPTLPQGFENCRIDLLFEGENKGSYNLSQLYTSKTRLPSPSDKEIKTAPGVKSFRATWGLRKEALPYIRLEFVVDAKYAGLNYKFGYRDLRTESYKIGGTGQGSTTSDGIHPHSSDSMTFPQEQIVEVDYQIFTTESNGNGTPLEQGVLRAKIEGKYINKALDENP